MNLVNLDNRVFKIYYTVEFYRLGLKIILGSRDMYRIFFGYGSGTY